MVTRYLTRRYTSLQRVIRSAQPIANRSIKPRPVPSSKRTRLAFPAVSRSIRPRPALSSKRTRSALPAASRSARRRQGRSGKHTESVSPTANRPPLPAQVALDRGGPSLYLPPAAARSIRHRRGQSGKHTGSVSPTANRSIDAPPCGSLMAAYYRRLPPVFWFWLISPHWRLAWACRYLAAQYRR